MGLHKNNLMENSKKMILYSLLVFFFFSCKGQEKESEKINKTFIQQDKVGNLWIKVPCFLDEKKADNFYIKNDSIFFKSVTTSKNIQVENKNIIDIKTFVPIPLNEAEKGKINNSYYINNPFYNYFRDKNYIYIYSEENFLSPTFLQIEKPNNYELLGGAYIRINDKIYWRGLEVLNADISSFKVINVQRNKSEWEASIGTDQKHIYSGDKIMIYQEFSKNYLWNNQVEYQKKYFPNQN